VLLLKYLIAQMVEKIAKFPLFLHSAACNCSSKLKQKSPQLYTSGAAERGRTS
jgi:hypothetical protein